MREEPRRAAHLRMPIVLGNRICGELYKNAETITEETERDSRIIRRLW